MDAVALLYFFPSLWRWSFAQIRWMTVLSSSRTGGGQEVMGVSSGDGVGGSGEGGSIRAIIRSSTMSLSR